MRRRRTGRSSFTLIEILIVVAVISILLAIAVAAYFRTERVAQQKAAESFITNLDSAYKKALDKVLRDCRTNGLPPEQTASFRLMELADNNRERAKVLYVKLTLRLEFPMNFYEALNPPYPLSAKQTYVDKLAKAGITQANVSASDPVGPWESSICLAMALEEARGGITVDLSNLGSNAIKDCPYQDPNPNHAGWNYQMLRALVDIYGQPVFYFRWAGNFGDYLPNNVNGKNDPEDPEGLLSNPTWLSKHEPWFIANVHWIDEGASLKQEHLIVSAGHDGYLGIAPGTDADQALGIIGIQATAGVPNPISGPPGSSYTVDPTHEADNIYSNRVNAPKN